MSYRQCHRKVWLDVHAPELQVYSDDANARFASGNQVGEIARGLFDPTGCGAKLDPYAEGWQEAFSRTQDLLQLSQPIFEAAFRIQGALCLGDILLPADQGSWRMVEVKSSTYKVDKRGNLNLKDALRDDIAFQAHVARAAGLPLAAVSLALVDSKWVYPGGGNYQGLLREVDLTDEAFARDGEVGTWIAHAQTIVAQPDEPQIATGEQCDDPYECAYKEHCGRGQVQAEYPVQWLPGRNDKLKALVQQSGLKDMRDAPDDVLTDKQRLVKQTTIANQVFFDNEGASDALAGHSWPAYFLDFEGIAFTVPIWAGTRPFQQIPFQFSVHCLSEDGALTHKEFLDLSGGDPSRACAEALVPACGKSGSVYVYNKSYEQGRISDFAARFPDLAAGLLALNNRIVDLLPVAREYYYHPAQKGSWSIKSVLPAMFPDDPALSYDELEEVQDGGLAQQAYLEAIHADTTSDRRQQIESRLLAYCKLDTLATIMLWSKFVGKDVPRARGGDSQP
jgi:hypothetical protein